MECVVKKAAAISASVALGAVGALAPTLAAKAATVTTPCAVLGDGDNFQHYDPANTNWFNICIPQYGRGKAEFTITSDVDFPADFKDLTDPSVSVSSEFDAAPSVAYFSESPTNVPYDELTKVSGDARSQTYRFDGVGVHVKIAGVESIPTSSLPTACTADGYTYANAYKVTFDPTTVRFDQVVGGEHWTYNIVVAPDPIYLGMTPYVFSPGPSPVYYADDPSHAMCWSNDTVTIRGANDTESDWSYARNNGAMQIKPFIRTGGFEDLGTFNRIAFKVNERGLANTGSDARPALFAGVGLLMAGLVATFVARRRKRSR